MRKDQNRLWLLTNYIQGCKDKYRDFQRTGRVRYRSFSREVSPSRRYRSRSRDRRYSRSRSRGRSSRGGRDDVSYKKSRYWLHVLLNKIELTTKSKSIMWLFLQCFWFRVAEHFMTNQPIRSTGPHRRQNGVLRSIIFLHAAGKSHRLWWFIHMTHDWPNRIEPNPFQPDQDRIEPVQYRPTSSKSQILPIFLPKRRHINQSQIRVMTANHKIDKHRVTKSNHVKQITIHHVIRLFWIFFGIWSVSMSPLLAIYQTKIFIILRRRMIVFISLAYVFLWWKIIFDI